MMVALLGNARWMEEVNSIQMDGGSEVHSELSQREREREIPSLSTWTYRDSRAQCSHFTPTHI